MSKLLLVFAHPDDESFSCAGTVARYVKAGWEVDLLCATKGEAGSAGEYGTPSRERLGIIRASELEHACEVLGISSLTFLEYQDGELVKQHAGEIEDKVYAHMVATLPDCVITFDTTGISNHPDHIRLCYAVTFAFQKYATWAEEKLAERNVEDDSLHPKLYYACMPESVATFLKKAKTIPGESFGKPWIGTPDKMITTVMAVGKYQKIKVQALQCHVSQRDDVERFLSLSGNPLLTHEYFMLRLHGTREVFMGRNDKISSKL